NAASMSAKESDTPEANCLKRKAIAAANTAIAAVPGSNFTQPMPARAAAFQAEANESSIIKPSISPQKRTQTVKKTAPEGSRQRAVAASSKANAKVASVPSTMIPE